MVPGSTVLTGVIEGKAWRWVFEITAATAATTVTADTAATDATAAADTADTADTSAPAGTGCCY